MKSIKSICKDLSLALTLFAAPCITQAVTLDTSFVGQPFLDTSLGGTTSAARPELGGLVLEDDVQPFSFFGVTGTVQNRVVRETTAGTLDFYWRIKVDPTAGTAAAGAVSAFRLGDFGYGDITDADWRIDGLGSAAPYTGRVFNPADHPEGFINFIFSDGLVLPGDSADPGSGSRFFFLHTTATEYARTAQYDLLDNNAHISGAYSTFAPSQGVPDAASTSCLLLLALGALTAGRPLLKA